MAGTNGFEYEDISQGLIGDCYLLAGLAGLQEEYPEIADKIVLTEDVNENGSVGPTRADSNEFESIGPT